MEDIKKLITQVNKFVERLHSFDSSREKKSQWFLVTFN